jgi:hypothetical protein
VEQLARVGLNSNVHEDIVRQELRRMYKMVQDYEFARFFKPGAYDAVWPAGWSKSKYNRWREFAYPEPSVRAVARK